MPRPTRNASDENNEEDNHQGKPHEDDNIPVGQRPIRRFKQGESRYSFQNSRGMRIYYNTYIFMVEVYENIKDVLAYIMRRRK